MFNSGNPDVDRRQEIGRLNLIISTWPRGNDDVDSQARRELATAYRRRGLNSPREEALGRFMEGVKTRYRRIAESLIDARDRFWVSAAGRQTIEALPELARAYANAVQLVAMGGGDEQTRQMVGVREIDGVIPARQTDRPLPPGPTPGRTLADAIAEAIGGRTIDVYREPVIVQVEDEEGQVETLPPVRPCELDDWGIDVPGWYWLSKMYNAGMWG